MPRNIAKGFIKATTVLLLSVISAAAIAQSTTSSIRGKLLDSAGNAVANAEVIVIDQRTGSERRVRSNNSGTFFASNLQVGGPFVVTVDGVESATVPNISLGDAYNLTINDVGAAIASDTVEEVVVLGKAVVSDVSSGPSAIFSQDVLESAVAFNRDIKDVFSNDPRINLDDPSRGSGVNCGGKNPRFNSLSIDGVGQNDRFGLNNNGFASSNGQPFPFDALEQVSVELAPFNVTAGGFSACAINAVTKSGRNEFFGSAVYEFSSDSLRGDSFEFDNEQQIDVDNSDFTEETIGFTLGGPIIEDKLFFFLAYEESEQPLFNAAGFAGSGNGDERDFLSEADFNRIVDISNRLYGYDPGGLPQQGANERDALIGRLDWDINDAHRATLIYNKFEGGAIVGSDNDPREFEFANHFYNRGSDLETAVLRLSSQWTDNLSTEVFLGRQENIAIQETVGDPEFGDFQISIGRNTVYLGADDSRQANGLNYDSNLIKFNLQYLTGNHVITAGFERDKLDIFNLFVQHSRGGELDFFDDSGRGGLSGIDKFELGLPDRIFYGSGGGTNNPDDAAANYSITQETLLIQDEYFFENLDLTVVGGLRYERFSSDDRPAFNAAFTAANGIRNDANIDGVDILQPRVGFTWDANDYTRVRGGVGIFSGGNPNVWISNSYSNDGITNVQVRESFDQSLFDLSLTGAGRPGFDVPQELVDQVANTTPEDAATRRLVLIDPDYEQPSELKFALGATFDLRGDYRLDADVLYSKQRDSAIYRDISQRQVGVTAVGTPILESVVGSENFMLTNSDVDADTLVLSLGLSKKFENGLSMTLGYAYSDAEDVSGMNSSVAFSNFNNVATSNPNNVQAGTSEFNTPNRFTFRLGYESSIFGDLMTRMSIYGVYKNGQGTSLTMSNTGLEANDRGRRQLLYVPNAGNDSAVVYADGFDRQGFDELIASRSLARGQFVSRNSENARSSARVDLRIDQELPSFAGIKPKVFLKVNNFLNLLNDDWGAQFDAPFVSEQVVESNVNDAGQFVFENFRGATLTDTIDTFSVWQARVGIEFKF